MYGASTARLLALTATALISASAARPANAMPSPIDPGPAGNGNRNMYSANSPTSNHGYQHTNNSNAGGLNSVLNALCRRARTCHLTQNLIIKVQRRERNKTPMGPFLYVGRDEFVLAGVDFP
jgi:hypothetical protein